MSDYQQVIVYLTITGRGINLLSLPIRVWGTRVWLYLNVYREFHACFQTKYNQNETLCNKMQFNIYVKHQPFLNCRQVQLLNIHVYPDNSILCLSNSDSVKKLKTTATVFEKSRNKHRSNQFQGCPLSCPHYTTNSYY
jgi:hypothetical protein